MHADVERVSLSFPSGAQAAGDTVHFEDGRFVAVHAGVAAGRKPRDARTDYDNAFSHVLPPTHNRLCSLQGYVHSTPQMSCRAALDRPSVCCRWTGIDPGRSSRSGPAP